MKTTRLFHWISTVALLSLVSIAHGQTEAGTYFVGSNVSHLSLADRSTAGRTTSRLYLKPALGKFVVRNIALGLEVPYNYENLHTAESDVLKTTYLGISPFVRYYVGKHETIKPFIGLTAGWRHQRGHLVNDIQQLDEVYKESGFLYGLTAGVAFFLNSSVSVEVNTNYTDTPQSSLGTPGARLLGLSYGYTGAIRVGLGFQVYLGRSKYILPCTY